MGQRSESAAVEILRDTFEQSKRTSAASIAALTEKYDALKVITAGLERYIMQQGAKLERAMSAAGHHGQPAEPAVAAVPAVRADANNFIP